MPQHRLPTPASSSELPARDGAAQLAASQLPLFALPPPAKQDDCAPGMPSPPLGPDAAPPVPPAPDAFALPPPPTRTRTILQVWPDKARGGSKARAKTAKAAAVKQAQSTASASASTTTTTTTTPTTTAGRKTARRTAHSLIERRRRSKMNEAFAALQELVPACTGDMHKLAVLQASIDYVRYLEGCVATLQQRANTGAPQPTSELWSAHAPQPARALQPAMAVDDGESSDDGESMVEDTVLDDAAEDGAPTDTAPDTPTATTADTAASAATAALLMLNRDRRGSTDPGRGMRVRDLLST